MEKTYSGELYKMPFVRWNYSIEKWLYQYDSLEKIGNLYLEWEESVLEVKWEVARKIHALLYLNDRWNISNENSKAEELQKYSNCHITSNYLTWLDNEIGNIKSWRKHTGISDNHNTSNEEGIIPMDMIEYSSIDKAISDNELPLLCRIVVNKKPYHSMIILWKMEEGRIIWFEQRWMWGEWIFCDIEQEIHAYTDGWLQIQGRQLFCKAFSLPSQK